MEKLDLIKKYKAYYTAKSQVEILNFGKVPYLTILGEGEPAGIEFSKKARAIFRCLWGKKDLQEYHTRLWGSKFGGLMVGK